jgi:hypothetical protein
MAEHKEAQMSEALATARDQAAYHAASEVAAVAAMLRDQEDTTDAEFVRHGALMRLEALGNAMVILLGCGRERPAEIAIEYESVFGKKLEVSNG